MGSLKVTDNLKEKFSFIDPLLIFFHLSSVIAYKVVLSLTDRLHRKRQLCYTKQNISVSDFECIQIYHQTIFLIYHHKINVSFRKYWQKMREGNEVSIAYMMLENLFSLNEVRTRMNLDFQQMCLSCWCIAFSSFTIWFRACVSSSMNFQWWLVVTNSI